MDLDVLAVNARRVMELKSEFEAAMPQVEQAIGQGVALRAEMAQIREEMAPVLEWMAEQKRSKELEKQTDIVLADDKPSEQTAVPANPDRPLDHIADVEASLDADHNAEEHAAD